MTIVSIKEGTGGESRRVELSDGSFFSFKIEYLPPVFIDDTLYTPGKAENMVISDEEEAGFRCASACTRAEKAALQLIARAEQNTAGLFLKLKKRGHDAACARAAIARLCETGLLDDRRYARLWLESRISRQAGTPRRLLAALRTRGIDQDDAEPVLKSVLDHETERRLLDRYVEKQSRSRRGDNDADTRRSLKYLLKSEGFSYAVIQDFCEEKYLG